MSEKKEYYFFTDFIKVIAILLIINSHMDPIYPVKVLATGGALGNVLFFVVSGYLIRGKHKNFGFYKNMLLKLYIPIWIFTLIIGLNSAPVLTQLVWPTNFWFVGAIVLFYFLYGLLERIGVFEHYKLFMLGMIILYAGIYVWLLDTRVWVVETAGLDSIEGAFKLIYYFATMITGGVVKELIISDRRQAIFRWLCPISVVVMYGSKALMDRIPWLMHAQFVNQVCAFTFAVSMLIIVKNSRALEKLGDNSVCRRIFCFISRMSLEFYIVQFFIIGKCSELAFPLNGICAVLLIVISAVVLYYLAQGIIWGVKKIERSIFA